MIRRCTRAYLVVTYYLSWLMFGAVGLALNLGSTLLLPLPPSARRHRRTRTLIRFMFDLWIRWFHASGVVRVIWRGFPDKLPAGTVYVANHPTLVDAPLLLSRLPDAVCIFKPALMRNPAIGPAAIAADYAAGDLGIDVVRNAAARVAAGQSLLVFPEGTRTAPGTKLGSFKPGFALIALRAHAPVQLLRIRASPGLVRRAPGRWLPPAVLPGWFEITFDRRWDPDPDRRPAELAAEIERHLLNTLTDAV